MKKIDRPMERCRELQTNRSIVGQMDGWIDRYTYVLKMNRQTDIQTNNYIDREKIDLHRDSQRETQIN